MRRVVCWLLAIPFPLFQGRFDDVAARGCPDKPVRVIVPAAPGGSTDQTGHLFVEAISSSLKQPFFVKNRPEHYIQ